MVHDSVIVSFSGGKDSLTVLDLAKRVFNDVKCFYMYFVPDMEYSEKKLEYAKIKYGVEILEVYHWLYFKLKKKGIYCLPVKSLKEIKLNHIYSWVRDKLGDYPILHGGKRSDSEWRHVNKKTSDQGEYASVYYPIYEWNKYDVLSYLSNRGITIPETGNEKGASFGLDLSTISLNYLRDKKDRELITEEFPFVEAYYQREIMYG